MQCLRDLAVLADDDDASTSDTDPVLRDTAAAVELCDRALLEVKQSPSLTNRELEGLIGRVDKIKDVDHRQAGLGEQLANINPHCM